VNFGLRLQNTPIVAFIDATSHLRHVASYSIEVTLVGVFISLPLPTKTKSRVPFIQEFTRNEVAVITTPRSVKVVLDVGRTFDLEH